MAVSIAKSSGLFIYCCKLRKLEIIWIEAVRRTNKTEFEFIFASSSCSTIFVGSMPSKDEDKFDQCKDGNRKPNKNYYAFSCTPINWNPSIIHTRLQPPSFRFDAFRMRICLSFTLYRLQDSLINSLRLFLSFCWHIFVGCVAAKCESHFRSSSILYGLSPPAATVILNSLQVHVRKFERIMTKNLFSTSAGCWVKPKMKKILKIKRNASINARKKWDRTDCYLAPNVGDGVEFPPEGKTSSIERDSIDRSPEIKLKLFRLM